MGAKPQHIIGFDLGGTKMIAAVLDAKGQIVAQAKDKTRGEAPPEAIFGQVVGLIHKVLDKAELAPASLLGIGIGSPGPLDRARGVILETPNLNLHRFPLKARLEKEFGCSALVENDVNAGTYGEFRFGAAQGFRHVLGIFPGTGIGGGLVLNGELYVGATGAAGEVGHMILQIGGPLCGCGQYGCLEALASRTAMAKDAVALAANGTSPVIFAEAGTDFKAIGSKVLKKAVQNGDQQVGRLVERAAEFLGIGMANCVNLLSPEVIVIGGGLIEKFGHDYLKVAERSMRAHAMPFLVQKVKVVAAKLGDEAVVRGAAALLKESLTPRESRA